MAAVVKTLSRFSPARYELTIDGEALLSTRCWSVVGSGIQYGGGMKVLPDACVNDGLLDVCIVEALSKTAFLRAFPRCSPGRTAGIPRCA